MNPTYRDLSHKTQLYVLQERAGTKTYTGILVKKIFWEMEKGYSGIRLTLK